MLTTVACTLCIPPFDSTTFEEETTAEATGALLNWSWRARARRASDDSWFVDIFSGVVGRKVGGERGGKMGLVGL